MKSLAWLVAAAAWLAFQGGAMAAPTPIDLPTANGQLLSKAPPDECFDGIGVNYPSGPPCATGRAKVNQAYVWGLAKTGNQLWFGTVPNTHCLVQGAYLGSTGAYSTNSWVCEFGSSQPVRLGIPPVIPANALPPAVGDFRPPRIYVYDTVTQVTTEKVLAGPAAALLASTIGIRAAGTLGDVVLLAGPALSGGINVFAFRVSTGTLIGAQNLPAYVNIRKFLVVDGVLYAGVGRRPSAPPIPGEKLGRILRWTGSLATPIAFDEVGRMDSMAAELAEHEGRIFVTTWPDGELGIGGREAGLYMSPPIPVGGFTAAGIADWTKVWSASDYDPDPVTAATYGGGALASFDGFLYWGTMHVPSLSTLAHYQAYPGEQPSTDPERLQWFLGSERAVSIFRGRNFAGASPVKEVVYGYPQMSVYVKTGPAPGSWQVQPNRMGPPRWGMAGFNNLLNNYTWSMAVSGGRLWVGTMDWSWLLAAGIVDGASAGSVQAAFPGTDGLLGADLWYFPATNSPAFPESTAGVGNPSTYGIRNMVVGPNLYLGMANPMNLLTDPGQGPVGGWELIELAERAPNTVAGAFSRVELDGGARMTFCNVTRSGYTASLFIPFSSVLPAASQLSFRPTDVLMVTSSASWRDPAPSSCGSTGLARIFVPYEGLAIGSRILQLVWQPESGTWTWEDITVSVTAQGVEGALTGNFLGILAIQPARPVPTLGSAGMLALALALILGVAAAGRSRLRRIR